MLDAFRYSMVSFIIGGVFFNAVRLGGLLLRSARAGGCPQAKSNKVCGWLWVASAVSVLLLGGCVRQQIPSRPTVASFEIEQAQSELESRIEEFADFFQATVEQSATEIERKSAMKDHRRTAIMWRVNIVPQCRAAANLDDDRESLLALWTLSQRMVDHFSTGHGKAVFGEHQHIAREASQKIHNAITELVRPVVSEDSYKKIEQDIIRFARAHPMATDFTIQAAESFSDEAERKGALRQLMDVSLTPVTAIQDVGRTPGSIRDVSQSFDRFTDVVEDLPASTRWQLQLLAMDLEERPTVSQITSSLKQFSDSAERFAQTLDEMPEKIRKEANLLLELIDAAQPEWRTTLSQTQETIESIQSASHDLKETATEFQRTVASINEASVALENAANAVTLTAKEILKFIPEDKKDESGQIITKPEPGKGMANGDSNITAPQKSGKSQDGLVSMQRKESFSIQAVTESAKALSETSEKLQVLLADLRDFTDAQSLSNEAAALSQQVEHTMDSSLVKMEGLVDHIAKRAVQLLFLLFILAVAYRFISVRIHKKGV